MALYKAMVKDKQTGEKGVIESEYESKTSFIRDLRLNGYSVTDWKVKKSDDWNRIIEKTNATEKDWRK